MARLVQPVLIGTLVFGACSADPPAEAGSVERDSAGIRIVESRGPRWGPDEGWRVDSAPALTIGVSEGAPEYELFRVIGAVRLRDGTIVVGNSGTAELRFYDANGTYVRTAGGRGEGPGEFQRMQIIRWWPGDSVATADFRLRRVQLFAPTGTFARSVLLEPGRLSFIEGMLAEGAVLMVPGVPLGFQGTGVSRVSLPYFVHRPDGSIGDTLGEFLGGEFYQHGTGSPPNIIQLPFGKGTRTTTNGHIFLGTNEAFEVRVFTGAGTLERIFRILEPLRAVTAADRARARAAIEMGVGQNQAIRRSLEAFDAAPIPDAIPAFDRLLVDRIGHLWMRMWGPENDEPSTWRVFDRGGSWLGEVDVPKGAYPLEIGSDYLLARVRDEFDIEQVVMYALQR